MSEHAITCDSPPLETTTGDSWYNVAITLDGDYIANSSQIFKYYRQPQILSITPNRGPLEGGTESIIRGVGFKQPNICGLSLKYEQVIMDFTLLNDTAIKVTSRANNLPGSLVVSLSGNNQQFINDITLHMRDIENTFTYYHAFLVKSL